MVSCCGTALRLPSFLAIIQLICFGFVSLLCLSGLLSLPEEHTEAQKDPSLLVRASLTVID